jgi:ubiquitin C-terminal hydrolase
MSDNNLNIEDPSIKDPTYSLFAVVNHSGSLNGGHYTA